jgi:chorismate mutase
MDRLNARLAALIQSRARLVASIVRRKARHEMPAPDPAREREMLRAALASAPKGFPRRDLETIFRTIFRASRRLAVKTAPARRH